MTGAEVVATVAGPQHVERRILPRPQPEHVLALVADLTAARELMAGTETERARGVALVALVEHMLTNLAGALQGGRR